MPVFNCSHQSDLISPLCEAGSPLCDETQAEGMEGDYEADEDVNVIGGNFHISLP
jgi:hypothetical protein